MKTIEKRKPWQLKARDFNTGKVYAEEDWRFQMFFEYLRISPSYALATTCKNEKELAKRMGDKQQAAVVWKTYVDVGNVFCVLYREWWLNKGLSLFGIQSARPRVESVTSLASEVSVDDLLATGSAEFNQFMQTRYTEQGMPDSLLVSIPLGMKRMAIMKQLKLLLDATSPTSTDTSKSVYRIERNKMRYARLKNGLRLVYMKAALPSDELWRAAARAKISKAFAALDPKLIKKAANTGVERRMMTIMASRLMHDSLVIAENAARGSFPSLAPVSATKFDFALLGKRLKQTIQLEKARKEQLLAVKKTRAPKTVV